MTEGEKIEAENNRLAKLEREQMEQAAEISRANHYTRGNFDQSDNYERDPDRDKTEPKRN